MTEISKLLIYVGALLMLIGIGIHFIGKAPGIGKLPGDIFIKKENFTFYFPVTTSIILSVILSLILFFFSKR